MSKGMPRHSTRLKRSGFGVSGVGFRVWGYKWPFSTHYSVRYTRRVLNYNDSLEVAKLPRLF